MRCPSCSSMENKVIDSRINQTGDITRRRRECLACQGRFTTYERVEAIMPMIIKKDGRREPFNRDKIFIGIQKSCQKRPITTAQIEKTVTRIERRMAAFSVKELPSRAVGELVMQALHQLDTVAYIRFASVYREFKDVEEFVADLKETPQPPESDDEMMFEFANPEKEEK
ncbi:MAG: transcriptional repressor NrdR [Deltaproteobacteria bacterium]|nr:transcriptional repressor NrdR [Deltaproteobacteria bacterium]